MVKKSTYNFDFIQLEKDIDVAYEKYMEEETEETKKNLYLTIKEIAYGILKVDKGWATYNLNYETVSYEYAAYLIEKILSGIFVREIRRDKFPWQHYISKNLKHVVITKREDEEWHNLIDDTKFLLDDLTNDNIFDKEENGQEHIFSRNDLCKRLLKSLKIFYTMDEIKRLYPLAIEYIDREGGTYRHGINRVFRSGPGKRVLPKDIREFNSILIALAKRLLKDENVKRVDPFYGGNFSKIMSGSIRSSVFLASIVNADFFPRELFLALDIDSLYRLVNISGGETIKIPTQNELETLLGAVIQISKNIIKDEKLDKYLNTNKEDLELIFSRKISLQAFTSKILESLELFQVDKETEPLVNLLIKSLESVVLLFKEIRNQDHVCSSDCKCYNKVVETFEEVSKLANLNGVQVDQ